MWCVILSVRQQVVVLCEQSQCYANSLPERWEYVILWQNRYAFCNPLAVGINTLNAEVNPGSSFQALSERNVHDRWIFSAWTQPRFRNQALIWTGSMLESIFALPVNGTNASAFQILLVIFSVRHYLALRFAISIPSRPEPNPITSHNFSAVPKRTLANDSCMSKLTS